MRPPAASVFGFINHWLVRPLAGREDPDLALLAQELRSGLECFHQTARSILAGSGVRLLPLAEKDLALERHFFSALFLYAFYRGRIPHERRVFYAAINQCLRGMVTGCDNLLDDEYKKTLETDLPASGTRFRSVLDIMVSDRVLFELLSQDVARGTITEAMARQASTASLRALVPSGAQESSEECGISEVLPPEEVLEQVHHYKTGLLFQSVWAVPEALGDGDPALITDLKHALYRIGLGCQVLDDLVDLQADVRNHRHNYVASLIRHASDLKDWEHLVRRCGDADIQEGKEACLDAFPEARRTAVRTARELLGTGLTALLDPRHRAFVNPALQFIAERIGAAAIMEAVPLENG